MEPESDEWREPWDESLFAPKCKCSKCGKVVPSCYSHVVSEGTLYFLETDAVVTREVVYCKDCYDKKAKVFEKFV